MRSYQAVGEVVHAPAPSAAYRMPTLADLSRSIGSEVAHLVEAPSGDQQSVSGSLFYDRSACAPRSPGAIALAIGIALTGEQLIAQFQELLDAGYVALVYKANGSSDADFRRAARSSGMALFRAADPIPWGQLSQVIDAAIIPHGESVRTLVDIRPGDLFELANTVALLSGGAIAIADPEQTLLAYSTLPEQPIDDTRRASILQLHVPKTDQNDLDYRRVHKSQEVVRISPGVHSLTRFAVAIRAGDVVLGSLWLIDAHDNTSSETTAVLLEAANVAALHLLHRRTNLDSGRTRQIDLVKPLLFEPDRAELAAVQLGISAQSIRVVAMSALGRVGDAPEALRSSLHLFDTVRTMAAVWLPTAVCGLADNIVYIVIPQGPAVSQPFQREAILRITHHARRLLRRPLLTGIGRAVPIARLRQSRSDSEVVLGLLLHDAEEGKVQVESDDIVADHDSLGPRLHLRQIVSSLRAAALLPGDYWTEITDYDSRKKTFFEETIRTYLTCNSNAIETANRLHLHANTVRYRLSRVEMLFGLKLEDPETRLLLWLQLWAEQN